MNGSGMHIHHFSTFPLAAMTPPNRNERGFVLVVCMIMLVVLSVLGIMATRTSVLDLKATTNVRMAKTAFYHADSGIFTAPKVIRNTVLAGSAGGAAITGIRFLVPNTDNTSETDSDFYRKILGFETSATDIKFPLGQGDSRVTIQRSGQTNLPGGSTEFASGYEGIGHGYTGAIAIYYSLDSTGTYSAGRSVVGARYRYVPGTAGGL